MYHKDVTLLSLDSSGGGIWRASCQNQKPYILVGWMTTFLDNDKGTLYTYLIWTEPLWNNISNT